MFGSFYLDCLNPFILRCSRTTVLSLIPVTPYPLRRTHIHHHERVYLFTKNLSSSNRNSWRLWAKKIRVAAAVWVWHGFASPFQLSVTVWERGAQRNLYKVQKNQWLHIVYCCLRCSSDITYRELCACIFLPHRFTGKVLSLKNC